MKDKIKDKYAKERKRLCKELCDIAIEKGITQMVLADKTGFDQGNISRMFRGVYSPTLDNFLVLAEAVGCKIIVEDGLK